MKVKICFAGLGSIGTRHLRNLVESLKKRNVAYEIHALRNSTKPLPQDIQQELSRQVLCIEDLDGDYDIGFVTNPTVLHYETVQWLSMRAKHLFIEKPLFDSLKYDVTHLMQRSSISYIAAPLRHSAVFKKMQELLEGKKVFCARSICSSYLPEWRTGSDYSQCYSAHKDMGGGVRLDLIHEWDYLCTLFGVPDEVHHVYGHFSELEIDSEDLAVYIGKYPDKIVELHLDYFGRTAQRNVQLYMDDACYTVDFLKSQIYVSQGDREYTISLDPADIYVEEMDCFLDLCFGIRNKNPNSIKHAYEILKVVLGG